MLNIKGVFTSHGATKVVYRELAHDFLYSFISFKAFYIDNFCRTVSVKKASNHRHISFFNFKSGKAW